MSHLLRLLTFFALAAGLASAAPADFTGRWRLDTTRSTALDGWHAWDLVITTEGSRVTLRHDMTWRTTKHSAANTFDTTAPAAVKDFFRVEQRHMALYPAKGGTTTVRAEWIDGGRTLRTEALTPIEISQGEATMRITSEYRLVEGDAALLLIELHSSRPRPLVYRFTKVSEK